MFTLKVHPIYKDYLYLSFNFPESGILFPGEIVNYHFVLYGMHPSNITVDLERLEGNPHLYIKRCNNTMLNNNNNAACSISPSEI